jgi:hypothetical protein
LNLESWSARAALYVGALLFSALTLAGPPPALASGEYADELVERAREARLHEDPAWRTLVHYRRGWFGDGSLVDDPDFFASPDGEEDPEAELEATIRAFFEPMPTEGKHPVCRFAARFDWLKERLHIDPARLPVPVCEPVEEILETIAPKSVVVVFPTAYMNSPASMYGHTLLVIENVHGSEMLANAVNYAGRTDTTFGPLYAVKGILGFYEGYYSIMPYYLKLQEYNDVSDRDIWEYRLNLTEAEMRRMVLHIYELEDIHSDYYFFDENCSYNLLFLLDVARPGVGLTDDKGLWVIPLDTIRAIEEAGLVDEVGFRPAKSTKIEHLAAQLEPEEQDRARALANGEIEVAEVVAGPGTAQTKILVCDLASEYLQYRYFEHRLGQEEYAARFRGILAARATLGEADPGTLSPPTPPQPEGGHRSSRTRFGGGALDETGFAELRYRPVYHELLDNPRGYEPGSGIVFGELAFRYYPEPEDFQLEALTLIEIVSLAPRNRFFKPTSWQVNTGLQRRLTSKERRALVYDFRYGLGWTWRNRIAGMFYVLPELGIQLGGSLDDNHSIGLGGTAGVFRRLTRRWQLHLFARETWYRLGERDAIFHGGLGQNFELAPNWSLRADLTRSGEQDRWWWEWSAAVNLYH